MLEQVKGEYCYLLFVVFKKYCSFERQNKQIVQARLIVLLRNTTIKHTYLIAHQFFVTILLYNNLVNTVQYCVVSVLDKNQFG